MSDMNPISAYSTYTKPTGVSAVVFAITGHVAKRAIQEVLAARGRDVDLCDIDVARAPEYDDCELKGGRTIEYMWPYSPNAFVPKGGE
jgi:hypothetical protein